jgi:hypothetical protein
MVSDGLGPLVAGFRAGKRRGRRGPAEIMENPLPLTHNGTYRKTMQHKNLILVLVA